MVARGWGDWAVICAGVMALLIKGTGFTSGVTKLFWKVRVVMAVNTVSVLSATEFYTLKRSKCEFHEWNPSPDCKNLDSAHSPGLSQSLSHPTDYPRSLWSAQTCSFFEQP